MSKSIPVTVFTGMNSEKNIKIFRNTIKYLNQETFKKIRGPSLEKKSKV